MRQTLTPPPLAVLAAATLWLAGCTAFADGHEQASFSALVPAGATMSSASTLHQTEYRIEWRWSAHPESNVADSKSVAVDPPFVESEVRLPPHDWLMLHARLGSDQPRADLDLEILATEGERACQSVAGNSQEECHVEIEPTTGDSTLKIRVVSALVPEPTSPFTLDVTLVAGRWMDDLQSKGKPHGPEPHVLVAIRDSGVNPYHKVYYRPERTEHPCTYIQDFPCEVPALELRIGEFGDYADAVKADAATWAQVKPGNWYWIPRTNLVAVHCATQSRFAELGPCILDATGHGTATSSSVLLQNPDALLLVSQGEPSQPGVFEAGFPIDVHSWSWGPGHPYIADQNKVYAGDCQNTVKLYHDTSRLFVIGAGNWPFGGFPGPDGVATGGSPSTLADCISGNPYAISVGGAFPDGTNHYFGSHSPDLVSWMCVRHAGHNTILNKVASCGTSLAAPTVAGAISKAILELRRESGFLGGSVDGLVDPLARVSASDLRTAVNLSASYAPPRTQNGSGLVPNSATAPWLEWGWGFYDRGLVNETMRMLAGGAGNHPGEAVAWMEAQHQVKKTLWGR